MPSTPHSINPLLSHSVVWRKFHKEEEVNEENLSDCNLKSSEESSFLSPGSEDAPIDDCDGVADEQLHQQSLYLSAAKMPLHTYQA